MLSEPHPAYGHFGNDMFYIFQVFISKSYDATSHFETTCIDILEIYRRITGGDFDFSQVQQSQLEDDA